LACQLIPALLLVAKQCPELPHRHHLLALLARSHRHPSILSPFIRLSKIDIHLPKMR
jgi:hypothetical protein